MKGSVLRKVSEYCSGMKNL